MADEITGTGMFNNMANEPNPQHDETDDEAPPQWDEQPAREGGH